MERLSSVQLWEDCDLLVQSSSLVSITGKSLDDNPYKLWNVTLSPTAKLPCVEFTHGALTDTLKLCSTTAREFNFEDHYSVRHFFYRNDGFKMKFTNSDTKYMDYVEVALERAGSCMALFQGYVQRSCYPATYAAIGNEFILVSDKDIVVESYKRYPVQTFYQPKPI